jgi:hypothetical protein
MGLRGIGFGELNDQYKLHPHDISQGLLKTQQLYQEIKEFFSGYLEPTEEQAQRLARRAQRNAENGR